ncbi:MAG: hypothetical protein UV82_C0014G0033 [Candidatus Magasanikbacteria bacterium GW2011_GWD2_43_18]|nr:MAG: hypothetical protein UV18_C0008G0029 [Candidatus Magasanikbacteria bacterium GW2011_GWC2_42_27]KKT03892.1 MAG: hypothetical protein UV82_C0014G0033 [Candidatus Magasanikbacteria bacterium GW2011_GWD2_43_18]KKT25752.1 MAG: hypothetical protein UW10_C0004G0027 [Candidatus Magasanikbacteria bacterium GW2011_GWA2_43_9]HBB38223.1 hypothetical protein [Candidatus Magasanikbacteria bacterium]HCC14024.1 hypothetical protein [Candidatus Magasanikbacteria bacterium]
MPTITFKTTLLTIGSWTILRLPKQASAKLPSRGMCMVEGKINDVPFQTPLEPDGEGSHWFRVDATLAKKAGVHAGDTVTLAIEPMKEWPNPTVPADLKKALATNKKVAQVWEDITPIARWDWIRWIRSTNNADTRKKRIDVACSKMTSGMKRPCCFNRSMCTEPKVSKSGVLLDIK